MNKNIPSGCLRPVYYIKIVLLPFGKTHPRIMLSNMTSLLVLVFSKPLILDNPHFYCQKRELRPQTIYVLSKI